MLRITGENVHHVATLVCVCITMSYHVTYERGEYLPNGNIRICLHYENLSFYVWEKRVFTRWQHHYVSAIRTDYMLRITVESFHQMVTSVFFCLTNRYHITFKSGEISPVGNISICLHYEQLPCYVWQWRVFAKWQHQYVYALPTLSMLRIIVKSIQQMVTLVCVCIMNK